ncbi:MAG: hypothetical protein K6G12_09275 [Lachnospiraceae bacterium]|nr:hypothetical protein [Lachnospiraceae bacterium]
MKESIFRKESIEQISTPEQLRDHLKVTGPRLWMFLSAIIALLAGFIIFASVIDIEDTVNVRVEVIDGIAYADIPSSVQDSVKTGMLMHIADQDVKIGYIYNDNLGFVGVVELNEFESVLPDGVYEGQIVLESIKPIGFLNDRGGLSE